MMASEEHSIEQKESEEGAGQAGGEQSATLEIDLQAHGAEQGEKETEKKEEEVKEEGGAQASSAEQPSIPQPPYDEDFNPFSDKDLKDLLHSEESSDPNEGWKFINRTQFTEVWRKSDPTKPVHLVKGFLHLPGVPPNEVADVICDIEGRRKWDRQFPTIEILEEHKNFRVIYWLTKMPIGVANRDIVQFIRRQYDEETNTTYILYRNASHPKAPLKKGVVRAETILSATIIRPDPEDPTSTRLTILLQNDAKGWIPHFIINAFTARAPRQWRDSLYNYMRGPTVTEESEEKGEGEGEAKEEGNEGEQEEETASPQETSAQ